MAQIQLIKASLKDKSVLQQTCIDAYSTYFGDYWNEDGLEWYLNDQFGDEQLTSNLRDPNIDYFLISSNTQITGFIKVNFAPKAKPIITEAAELEKIYVLPEFKGKGIGNKAMKEIIKLAKERAMKNLYLDVLDSNNKAFDFYKRLGFVLHAHERLQLPYFKDDLRGMNLMVLNLE